ncbi:interferon-inducible GTPase-domain-containing protein [Fomitopsis serialis]|uniref:interferon-inducible GTPase-domain-containing protein n=1 Tax=Fomitopsis serialis TaxID=139415 RepID=UPI002007F557|nr:interferon-inducible GTPase-domain-containing protein [Neoantrodia serialis]KAH9928077.1 interferon-inducible GTPase-domain-containing protein [Neoantrodia serialis]
MLADGLALHAPLSAFRAVKRLARFSSNAQKSASGRRKKQQGMQRRRDSERKKRPDVPKSSGGGLNSRDNRQKRRLDEGRKKGFELKRKDGGPRNRLEGPRRRGAGSKRRGDERRRRQGLQKKRAAGLRKNVRGDSASRKKPSAPDRLLRERLPKHGSARGGRTTAAGRSPACRRPYNTADPRREATLGIPRRIPARRIAGIAGSGKSSFINALRGLRNGEPGAAETGIVETTSVIASYPDPDPNKHIAWYDVPGAGTLSIPDWEYFTDQGLYVFDCILVLFDARFTATDVAILRNCARFRIPAFVVRSKALQHIRNLAEDMGGEDSDIEDGDTAPAALARAREQYVRESRESVARNLELAELPQQRVYLVDKQALNSTMGNYISASGRLRESYDAFFVKPAGRDADARAFEDHINTLDGMLAASLQKRRQTAQELQAAVEARVKAEAMVREQQQISDRMNEARQRAEDARLLAEGRATTAEEGLQRLEETLHMEKRGAKNAREAAEKALT